MECKKALVEAKGDMSQAEDIIAKSGHKKAAKSASRTAAEGRIVIAANPTKAVMIEINCETDFVARDENFVAFCQKVAQNTLNSTVDSAEQISQMPFDGSLNTEEARQALVVRIGENIQIRRMTTMNATSNQRIGQYIHNSRMGTLVLIEGANDEVAKDVAMHITAMRPQFMTVSEIPAEVVAKEKEIFMERAKQSGKPDNILEKIVEGQLQKHFSEICLEGQAFFKDPDMTIGALLKKHNGKLVKMIRLEVGEGIEVVKKSFDEEVALARGSK